MKLTKKALAQLIKEELEDLQGFSIDVPAPIVEDITYRGNLEADVQANTEDIQEIFRVLKKNGYFPKDW